MTRFEENVTRLVWFTAMLLTIAWALDLQSRANVICAWGVVAADALVNWWILFRARQ